MRLDKYLKVSRLIKRRTLAKEVADQGRITLNGVVAKASTDVKVGDEMTIRFGNKLVSVVIDSIADHARKEDAKEMYRIVKEEKIESSPEV